MNDKDSVNLDANNLPRPPGASYATEKRQTRNTRQYGPT